MGSGYEAKHWSLPKALGRISVENAFKLATAMLASIYFVGLITMNAYLLRLGISDFSPFGTRYLVTGIVAVTPLLAMLAVLVWIGYLVTLATNIEWKWQDQRRSPPFRIVFLTAASTVFMISSSVVLSERNTVYMILLLPFLVFGFVMVYLAGATNTEGQLAFRSDTRLMFSVPAIVFVLIFLTAYGSLVAGWLLPKIPQQFGGAEPVNIRLVVEKDNWEIVETAGVELDESGTSQIVRLLWETADYIVLDGNREDQIIRISTSEVIGWRTESSS